MLSDADVEKHLKPYTDQGFQINAPAFAKIGTWNHILAQIAACHFYLVRLNAKPSPDQTEETFTWNAFFVAFLTTYGKCFNSSHGRLVSMDPNRVFQGQPDNLKNHEEIMRLRNTYAGHAGDSGLTKSTMLSRDNGSKIEVHHLSTFATPPVDGYLGTLTAVDDYVQKRLNKFLDKISATLGKPIEFGDLEHFTAQDDKPGDG